MGVVGRRDRGATGERPLSRYKHGNEQTIITIVYNGELHTKTGLFPSYTAMVFWQKRNCRIYTSAYRQRRFVWFTYRVTHGRVCGAQVIRPKDDWNAAKKQLHQKSRRRRRRQQRIENHRRRDDWLKTRVANSLTACRYLLTTPPRRTVTRVAYTMLTEPRRGLSGRVFVFTNRQRTRSTRHLSARDRPSRGHRLDIQGQTSAGRISLRPPSYRHPQVQAGQTKTLKKNTNAVTYCYCCCYDVVVYCIVVSCFTYTGCVRNRTFVHRSTPKKQKNRKNLFFFFTITTNERSKYKFLKTLALQDANLVAPIDWGICKCIPSSVAIFFFSRETFFIIIFLYR